MHQRPVEQCNKQRLNHSWQSGRLVYCQREVWSSVYNVPVCVHVEDSTHKAQRGGINSMLLRVEPGRHVRWNFSPQRALIWLWFKAMCILSDISLWHKGSSFFFFAKYQLSYMSMNDWPWLLYILWLEAPVLTTAPSIFKNLVKT